MKQRDLFLKTEGDNWFKRNIKNIEQLNNFHDLDYIINFLVENKIKNIKILEIGSSSGKKLDLIQKKVNSELYGLEPSKLAVEYCLLKYPNIEVKLGTADQIPWPSNFFDIVIFGFCLYVIDRELINKVISEADRVLRNEGLLIINDFDPGVSVNKSYHHAEGTKTFKEDYSHKFREHGYYLIQKKSYSHNSKLFSKDQDERVSIQILYKDNLSIKN